MTESRRPFWPAAIARPASRRPSPVQLAGGWAALLLAIAVGSAGYAPAQQPSDGQSIGEMPGQRAGDSNRAGSDPKDDTNQQGEPLAPTAASQGVPVVATGVGVGPESARDNAFSNAIQQVVGALVEAETLVKNDRIVRDQVLTYSRGYIEKFEVLTTWQQDGLHYCRIRAEVSAEKLGERLQSTHIALRKVPGIRFAFQLRHEQLSEDAARAMFRQDTADITWDKLLTVEIPEKLPEAERVAGQAKLTVHYRLRSNLEAWPAIRGRLKSLLDRICVAQTTAQYTSTRKRSRVWDFAAPLPNGRSRGDLLHAYLFKDLSPEGAVTYWDGYALPPWLEPEIRALAERHAAYQVRIVLLDNQDHVVAKVKRAVGASPVVKWSTRGSQFFSSSIGPLLYGDTTFSRTADRTETFALSLDQLARVAKCSAMLVSERKPEEPEIQ